MAWVTELTRPSRPMAFSDDKIRFVWTTDEHAPNNMTDPNVAALKLAVDDCNNWLPHAFISTGDIGNSRLYHVQRFFAQLWRCHRPTLITIGNHDEGEYPPASYGNPNTAACEGETAFDRSAPFYFTTQLVSGDGTVKARCIFLDTDYYDDDPDEIKMSAYHEPGDRVGISDIEPPGGYFRMLPQAQLDWIAATLAADSDSQMALMFIHFEPLPSLQVTNFKALADVLQDDGRPTIGFCGHNHGDARVATLTTTDTLRTYNFYKSPSLVDAFCWCRITLGWSGSAITVDGMVIYNYTDPGGWTIAAPFTLAP